MTSSLYSGHIKILKGTLSIIQSNNKVFELDFQADGNLVVYFRKDKTTRDALWASDTVGEAPYELEMQSDGNLVMYNSTRNPIWSTDTYGNPGAYLEIQDDANLVIYTPERNPLWSIQDSHKSWWDKFCDAFDNFTQMISDAVTMITDLLGEAWEKFWKLFGDGFYWFFTNIGLGKFGVWLGTIFSNIFDYYGSVGRGAFTFAGDLFSGGLEVFVGVITVRPKKIWAGIKKTIKSTISLIAIILIKAVVIYEAIFTIGLKRKLDQHEQMILDSIFHSSLKTSEIYIVEKGFVLDKLSKRALAAGNTIYFKGEYGSPPSFYKLVHEATHVWQYQNYGYDYLGGSVLEQAEGEAYIWLDDVLKGKEWKDLGIEKQAKYLEDLFLIGRRKLISGAIDTNIGSFFIRESDTASVEFHYSKCDLTEHAERSLKFIRAGIKSFF